MELCERHADCVEATLSDNGETWQAWTGFTDREAYVEGCLGVFEDSQGDGAGRGDLQKTCKAELDDDACP